MRKRRLGTTSALLGFALAAANAAHAVNTAPVLDVNVSPALYGVAEDSPAPSGGIGTPIDFLVDLASQTGGLDNVIDPDPAAQTGIAVTAASGPGTWWYTIDYGTTWNSLGAVSNTSARLLIADSTTRLYFQGNPNFFGNATLTFRAWDRTSGVNGGVASTTANGGSTAFSIASDTAPLLVYNVNDPPTLAGPPSINAIEDQQVSISGASVADVDGGNLTVGIQVQHGTVTLGTTAGLSFYVGSGSNDAAVTFDGSQPAINAALSTLSYRPTADYYGSDTLQLSVTDLVVNVPPLNIPVTIAPVVDVILHNVTTDEDLSIAVNPLNTDSFEGPASIAGVSNAVNGSATFVGNTITFTPNANFNGSGSFTYDVSSGGAIESGTVNVTVLAVNDPPTIDPIATPPTLDVNAGEQIIALSGIGAGPGETQALAVTATSSSLGLIPNPIVNYVNPAVDGTLRYTPQSGQGGVAIVTVTVTDNGGGNDHIVRAFQVRVDTLFKDGFE